LIEFKPATNVRQLRLDFQTTDIRKNAARAVNTALRFGRAEASRRIRQQIRLPRSEVSGSGGGIAIRFAGGASLEGRLTGASDPLPLAQFKTGSKGRTARVEVKPGRVRTLPNVVNFADGGFAIRSPRKPRTAYKPRRVGRDLWLLFGPSLAQGLLDRTATRGVFVEVEPLILLRAEREFLRLSKVFA